MSAGEAGVRALVGDWVIAVGVTATLLVTGVPGQHPTTDRECSGTRC